MKFIPFLAAALIASTAFAHTDEYLDTQKSANGGQLRMAGVYHFELVVSKDSQEAKDNPVVVYVTDHAGTKVPTVGAKGTATILSGKAKATVNLLPDGDNRLKGSGAYASTPDMKAIVSVTLPGKSPEQARFTPLAVPMQSAQDGHSGHSH
ncbi:MAG: hypothetical protein OEL86_11880 [Sulfuritalea sp.]|jgi:hypothetical protein|uniref:hypothetical protein n=1 Tax=Denitratisoma sp. DHT3 TaxID=1981880 RepID=UPI0011987E86|nr:hypothetical protein [Denitratisoma sp. DHT3]MDK9714775.1 hypothetical protein [Sulfuritalea sp.]QDX80972.1 hypothetical protein B9N43_06745 [Denitratisoma sp. DHT3]